MFGHLIENARLLTRLASDDFQAGDRHTLLYRRLRVLGTIALGVLALFIAIGMAHAAGTEEPAKGPALYTVEIVVFRTVNPVGVPEDWNTEVHPAAQANTSNEGETDEDSASGTAPARRLSVEPASATQFKLAGIDAALQRNQNYRVLAHHAWTQAATPRGGGAAVSLADLGTSGPLRGTVGFERGKYLYLQFDLTYTPGDPPLSLLGSGGPAAFTLKQKRRVRPFERHYLDHPAFGVVAMISPVKAPSAAP